MRYCPNCERELTADTEVFTTYRKSVHESVEIIGCENCIRTAWADEFFDEEELQEMEQDRRDQAMWDAGKDERYGV